MYTYVIYVYIYQMNSYTKDIEDYGEANIERNLCLIIFKCFMTLSLFYILYIYIYLFIYLQFLRILRTYFIILHIFNNHFGSF